MRVYMFTHSPSQLVCIVDLFLGHYPTKKYNIFMQIKQAYSIPKRKEWRKTGTYLSLLVMILVFLSSVLPMLPVSASNWGGTVPVESLICSTMIANLAGAVPSPSRGSCNYTGKLPFNASFYPGDDTTRVYSTSGSHHYPQPCSIHLLHRAILI